jgi:hypothetical protein
MSNQSASEQPGANSAALRGVIDQIEDDIATIVFDDGQRVEWPLRRLPEGAHAGDAIKVSVAGASAQALQATGALSALTADAGEASLTVEVDAEDTEARKERVRNLIDDIFKKRR